jgi:hypothetical protein
MKDCTAKEDNTSYGSKFSKPGSREMPLMMEVFLCFQVLSPFSN